MEGPDYSSIGNNFNVNKGIIQLSIDQLFEQLKSSTSSFTTFKIKISYLQLYNEAINDLLALE